MASSSWFDSVVAGLRVRAMYLRSKPLVCFLIYQIKRFFITLEKVIDKEWKRPNQNQADICIIIMVISVCSANLIYLMMVVDVIEHVVVSLQIKYYLLVLVATDLIN